MDLRGVVGKQLVYVIVTMPSQKHLLVMEVPNLLVIVKGIAMMFVDVVVGMHF